MTSQVKTAAIAALIGASLTMGLQSFAQHSMGGASSRTQMEPGAMRLHDLMMKSSRDMLNMKMPMDRDTDRLFDKSMAEHHLMGVRMAQIELRYGDDPASKRMAAKIVAAQTKERQQLLRLAAKAR